MISCTEFIPLYSELFQYLEELGGHEEVVRHWNAISDSTVADALGKAVRKAGIRGCWDYWSKSLNEEACDFRLELDEEAGTFLIDMRRCPSKGQLLDYPHIEPYYDYCGHCPALYDRALKKYGIHPAGHDLSHTDEARCVFRYAVDEKKLGGEKLSMNRLASDNEYFHRDFHSSMNMGVEYVGMAHGTQDVIDYLVMYTNDVYKPVINAIKSDPMGAIENKIRETYRQEKADDVLQIEKDENTLCVKILHCPAVKHLKETGRVVSSWFYLTTQVVMKTLAEHAGLSFTMEYYDEETGAAKYRFDR